jgi:hypothetical protein
MADYSDYLIDEDDEGTVEPTTVVVDEDVDNSLRPYLVDDYAGDQEGAEANWLTKSLSVLGHGMMDFLHGTILRFGSGGWRMTTQAMEHLEGEKVAGVWDEKEPPSEREILKQKAAEGYEDLPWYLKGLAAQPYADPTTAIDFLKGGGGQALAEGFWEGFTYDPDVDVESAWDITASGTAETRALDFLAGPAGPGQEWINDNPKKATAYAILLDIGYDPLTIFPFLITAPITLSVKSLIFGVKKAHTTIPGLSKATSALAENQALQEAFAVFGVSLGKDAKEIQRMFVDSKHLLNAANFKTALATKEGQIEIAALAARLGIPYDTFVLEWYRRIEGMPWGGPEHGFARGISDAEFTMLGATGATSPARLAQRDISIYRLFHQEATENLPLPKLGDDAYIPGVTMGEISGKRAEALGISTKHYYPHVDASRSALSRLFDFWRGNRPRVGSQGQRTRIGTAEEKSIVEGSDYVLDPNLAMGWRGVQQNVIMAGQNFLRGVAERWGRTRATAPEDWVPIEHIRGVLFEPHVAKQIDRTLKALRNTKETSRILAGMDKGTRWWKMWALALRPSYHMRNLFGNMWNSYAVGGMADPMMFQRANQLLFQALGFDAASIAALSRVGTGRGIGDSIVPRFTGIPKFSGSIKLGSLGDVSRKDLFDWLLEDGIIGVGRYSEEDILRGAGIDQSIIKMMDRDGIKKAFLNVFNPSTNNTLLRASFRGGRAIENWNRTALYLDALKRTGSRQKSKQIVNDALFDYTDMTPEASRWMRNKAIPFYTWYFKNTPAIIKGLFRNTRRYERAGLIKENIEWGEDIPTYEQLSEFAQGRDPVFVDKFMSKFVGDDGREDVKNVKRFINLLNYWPASDLNRLGDPADLIGELSNPYIKMIFEQFFNHSQYRDGKFVKVPGASYGMGEMKDFLGLRMPARIAYLLQMFPLLSEIDRTNPGHVFGKAEIVVDRDQDKKTGRRITSRAKFSPPWQTALPTHETDEEGNLILDEETGEPITSRATLRESRFEDMEGLPKFIAWLAGLKTYEYDKEAEFYREKKSNEKALNSTVSELKYLWGQAMRKGNFDAAHEINQLLRVFNQQQGEFDPLQKGTSTKRLRALGQ